MELCLENKSISAYRELSRLTKSVQAAAESVVPDTNDDVGAIASVQTTVFLKSKDIGANSVTVTGEAVASVIYITENRKSISDVRVVRQFSIEYEFTDAVPEAAQIQLSVTNVQARAVNPRKISVLFEITGILSLYASENFAVETGLPEEKMGTGLHVKKESVDFVTISSVLEKSFALSEQYVFPSDKPKPTALIHESCGFTLSDVQMIGTKAILKGQLNIFALYFSDEVSYPVRAEFSSHFSQIIDTGDESIDFCISDIEMTSSYFSIQDTISGEKALNAEIHALEELICCCMKKCSYTSDVYSNLMPSRCVRYEQRFTHMSELRQMKYIGDERLNIAEDCEDVLCVLYAPDKLSESGGRISAAALLDIIYRNSHGELASVKRLLHIEGDVPSAKFRILSYNLADVYIRPDGRSIEAHAAVELYYQSLADIENSSVSSVLLDEETPYNFEEFPSVILVRGSREDVWNYARLYHSSPEQIEAYNDLSGDEEKLLMIPRSI